MPFGGIGGGKAWEGMRREGTGKAAGDVLGMGGVQDKDFRGFEEF